ncbi:Nn.00g069370.m01.CDS01 [Neocucurbitaria sp. VM-36]
MSITEYHPRVLSLSAASTPSAQTPATQSRRTSHESAHDAHHFVSQQQKTEKTLNMSVKKMWKDIKHHAAEHHRSVNAAYQASYGAGFKVPAGPSN